MNDLIQDAVFVSAGQVFTSSDKVAEVFGKKHKNVVRAIKALINQNKRCVTIFEPTSVVVAMPNGGTRNETVYTMTRDGLSILAMGFTGEKALEFKFAFMDTFNAMEKALREANVSLPQPSQPIMLTTDAQFEDVMKRMKEEVNKKLDSLAKLEGSKNRARLVSIIPKLTDFMCESILNHVWRWFGIKPEEEGEQA
jgi:Rha family phage regulatory protein